MGTANVPWGRFEWLECSPDGGCSPLFAIVCLFSLHFCKRFVQLSVKICESLVLKTQDLCKNGQASDGSTGEDWSFTGRWHTTTVGELKGW